LASPTALGTANFCQLVNQLFDLTNNAAQYKAIDAENLKDRLQEIDRLIDWLGKLKFLKSDGKEFNGLSFHEGWQVSLFSLRAVSENQSQDHVENGFSFTNTGMLLRHFDRRL
jgi:hypothetical protein